MAYEYLKQYCDYPKNAVLEFPYNSFGSLYSGELESAESFLGTAFPSELKEFYKTIGVGCLLRPHIIPVNYTCYNANEILPPMVVAKFAKGILRWDNQNPHYISEETFESLQPGDLPVFELYDSSHFFIMKPQSSNPNAVYAIYPNIKIEDSFERFIWRLYYESPKFYGKIIDEYLEKEGLI